MGKPLNYYRNLTGLRAIAALLVMFLHFFNQLDINTSTLTLLAKISKIGQTGVTLFFVLSGFLITRILLHTKHKKGYFKNFYIRRTLRIFPLYYLFLMLFYFVFSSIVESSDMSDSKGYYFFYVQNFALTFHWMSSSGPGHLWSLAVEEHFYLIWPLIILICSLNKAKGLIYVVLLIALILRFLVFYLGYEIMWLTFTRMDSLAIGGLLAFYEIDNKIYKNSKYFLYLFCTCFILTFLTSYIFAEQKIRYIFHILKYTLWSFGFFGCIGYMLSVKSNHFLNKILNSKFLNYTGKISYGLYVYHLLIYSLVNQLLALDSWVAQFFISFTSTYIVSSVSYYLFEIYFLKLKKYFV